jgi:hypothetical protein
VIARPRWMAVPGNGTESGLQANSNVDPGSLESGSFIPVSPDPSGTQEWIDGKERARYRSRGLLSRPGNGLLSQWML